MNTGFAFTSRPDGSNVSTLDKQFLFVIGAPRSGTSWLHQMLAEHPAVAAMAEEELTIFSRYVQIWAHNYEEEAKNIAAGRWRQGLPCVWEAQEFEAWMTRFVEDVYSRVHARRPGATHILDKHPNYSNHLPMIDRFLPGSRFIHIIRDGREVAVSMMSVRRRVGHSPGEVRGAAHEWHRCVTNARAAGAALGPARYMEVRYEELRTATGPLIDRIFRFCGLAPDAELIQRLIAGHDINVRQVSSGDASLNDLRAKPGAIWKEKLGTAERYIFDRMAGALLKDLGYAQHGWWALNAADRVRMLPYGMAVRAKRSAAALARIWSTPVEEAL